MTPDPNERNPRKIDPGEQLPTRDDPASGIIPDVVASGLVGRVPELESIDDQLRQADIALSSAIAQQSAPIFAQLAEAETALQQYQQQSMGGIDRQLDAADQLLDRADGKIQERIADRLGEAYGYAQQLGYQIPTLEEIEAGFPGTMLPGNDWSMPLVPGDLPPLVAQTREATSSEPFENVTAPTVVAQPTTGSLIQKWRPGLTVDQQLSYWEWQGKWYISAQMPCGVPVPPGQGWVTAPWDSNAGPMYVFDVEQDAIDACKPVGEVADDEPPPPPPQPGVVQEGCEVKPYCPPCDIQFYFSEWEYGRRLTTEVPQPKVGTYICAVRAWAAFLCNVQHRDPISQGDYHAIRQSILDGKPPLESFPQWREKLNQTRGTEAWKLAFAWNLSCRVTLDGGAVVEHRDACNLSGDDCAKLLMITGQSGDGSDQKKPTVPVCDPADVFKLPKWGSLDACKDIDKLYECFANIQGRLSHYLGFIKQESGSYIVPPWWGRIVSFLPGWLDTLVTGVAAELFDGIQDISKAIPKSDYCNPEKMTIPVVVKLIMGFANKYLGGSLDDLMQGQTYAINYACPTLIPTAADALNLWRKGVIDEKLARCYLQANNWHFDPQKKIFESMATKPLVADIIRLHKMKLLKDEKYKELLAFNGVNVKDDEQLWLDAVKQVPPYTDLTMMMARDAEVEQIVEKRGYDEGFKDRWKGKVKEWAEAQGITEEVMKYIWRVHWRNVGLHQMAEAMFRLRKDKPGVVNVTTEDDVKEQLAIDDVPRFWRDRLVEALYRPLTRVDVRRSFEVDAIDEAKVKSSYLDEGYTEENAEALTTFAKVEKKRKQLKFGGKKPLSWYTQQFVAGNVTEQELLQEMQAQLKDQQTIGELYQDAVFQKEVKRRNASIKAIVKRYILGDYDYQEATNEMIRCNIPPDIAKEALSYCKLQDKLRSKQVPAAILCKWRNMQLISQAEHTERLVRIGYEWQEANLIATSCTIDINKRIGQELQAELAKQKREAEKALKELQKAKCKPKKQCPEGQE